MKGFSLLIGGLLLLTTGLTMGATCVIFSGVLVPACALRFGIISSSLEEDEM